MGEKDNAFSCGNCGKIFSIKEMKEEFNNHKCKPLVKYFYNKVFSYPITLFAVISFWSLGYYNIYPSSLGNNVCDFFIDVFIIIVFWFIILSLQRMINLACKKVGEKGE